tara:strand:- start:196 stop:957 length:762 start_codon:yes stop_codon:yes gene_type:complete
VKNIGSPLMQQRQMGSGQRGNQYGGYVQQIQKQIGGLQNQIQAMSQKQQATAAATPKPKTSTPNSLAGLVPYSQEWNLKRHESIIDRQQKALEEAQGATYEDTMVSIDGTKHSLTADQMKQYKINQAEGSLALSNKRWELEQKHGNNKAALEKEFEEWRTKHFSHNPINEQLGIHHSSLFKDMYSADPVAADPVAPPPKVYQQNAYGMGGTKLDNFLAGIPSGSALSVGGLIYSSKDQFRKAVLAGAVAPGSW